AGASMFYVPKTIGERAVEELPCVAWNTLKHAYSGGKLRRCVNPFTGEELVAIQPTPEAILEGLGRAGATDVPEVCEGKRAVVAMPPDAGWSPLMQTFWHYYSVIWHQGTMYEVTAYTVPFLCAFAADPDHPARSDLLQLLVHLFVEAHRSSSDP